MRIVNAACNFARDVELNREVAGGLMPSFSIALRQRLHRDRDELYSQLSLRGLPFVARYRDWLAVREVVFDKEYRLIRDILAGRDAPVVIDGGANIGMFALYALAYFSRARLASFEPSLSTFAVLARNHTLNPGLNWTVHHAALWRANEPLQLRDADWSTSSKVQAGSGANLVEACDLPAVLAKVGHHVDLMKIDIEGAEQSFLCAHPDQMKNVEHLLVELHPRECDTNEVVAVLRDRWSRLYVMPGRKSKKPLILATDATFDLPAFVT